jgi:hypothetical protein
MVISFLLDKKRRGQHLSQAGQQEKNKTHSYGHFQQARTFKD